MARALDLAVCAWSPLGGGLLTGKYLPGSSHEEAGTGRRADKPATAQAEAVTREVVNVAAEVGALPSQVALAWLLQRPGSVIPIVGATNKRQLLENLGCLNVELSPEQIRRLDETSAIELGFPYDFLQRDGIRTVVYGGRRDQIQDGRAVGRRIADLTSAEPATDREPFGP
jgi:aryl-alcohol dehydrogenase-like predicted oxidoreductase